MIPTDRLAAVTRAVHEAFGTSEIDDVHMITKGNSGALIFRIIVRGSPFLLRLIMRNPDVTLPQHFACMKIAADAGLAPRIRYTSIEDRLSITDFVATTPLAMPDALPRMPATLRALHALPLFPTRADHLNTTCTYLLNKEVAVPGIIERLQAANVLPKAEMNELIALYDKLVSAYPREESDQVSSHNDLFKPDNILFDGSRVWLVDWEAAFLNDRYADLAVAANMLVANDNEERAFLDAYLGKPANEKQAARFHAMRQLAHLFYALGFLFIASLSGPIDLSEPVPDFHDLRRRLWAGDANTADRPGKIAFARAHHQQLLKNM